MIRKISIGLDIVSSAMHFYVGQEVLDKSYVISRIERCDDGSYKLWLLRGDETFVWKEFNANLPITVEYNIQF